MSAQETTTHSLRISIDLKEYLSEQASENGRSLHGEIINRLKRTVKQDQISDEIVGDFDNEHSIEDQKLIELFKQIRRDQSALLDLLNSNDFAKQLFKRGFASVLK